LIEFRILLRQQIVLDDLNWEPECWTARITEDVREAIGRRLDLCQRKHTP